MYKLALLFHAYEQLFFIHRIYGSIETLKTKTNNMKRLPVIQNTNKLGPM